MRLKALLYCGAFCCALICDLTQKNTAVIIFVLKDYHSFFHCGRMAWEKMSSVEAEIICEIT